MEYLGERFIITYNVVDQITDKVLVTYDSIESVENEIKETIGEMMHCYDCEMPLNAGEMESFMGQWFCTVGDNCYDRREIQQEQDLRDQGIHEFHDVNHYR